MFKNVKKLVLWLMVIMLGSFALAAAMQFIAEGAEGFTKPGFGVQSKNAKVIDETKTLDRTGLENLNIFSTSTDITIIAADDSDIRAHLHGQIISSNKNYFPTLEAKQNGKNGEIKVTWPEVITVGYMNSDMHLDLYLPESYQQNLALKVSSAEILFEELTLKNFNCTSTSGDVTGKLAVTENTVFKTSSGRYNVNVQAQNGFTMESTSGDFKSDRIEAGKFTRITSSGSTVLESLNCTDFNYESTSGDLKVKQIRAVNSKINASSGKLALTGENTGKAEIKSTSGDITWEGLNAKEAAVETSTGRTIITGLTGSLEMKSTSGDADIQFSRLEGEAALNSSSGRISLKLPEGSEFALNCSTSSGTIHVNDFELVVQGKVSEDNLKGTVGNAAHTVELKTTSGDIYISKN